MLAVAIVFCYFLIVLAVYQWLLALVYIRLFFRCGDEPVADAELPKVAILVSLRGADPNLATGLKRLIQQDYPDYAIEIVIDSEQDPAASVVHEVIEETGAQNVRVNPLRKRPATCSLQCASMAQMIRELDDTYEVAVHVDGDTIVPATFLRNLVLPMVKDPRIGAAHGNRWFMPTDSYWGSLVRYLWNAAAVVAAYLLKIPCGGTLAMRMSMLRKAKIAERWEQCLTSDVVLEDALAEFGYKVRFIPVLMIPNRENIPLGACLGFFARQMLWSRLYQPRWIWWSIVAHGIITGVALSGALLLLICGLTSADGLIVLWSLAGLAIYQLGMLLFTAIMEYSVRHAMRAGGGNAPGWITPTAVLKLVAALPLTQCVQFLAVLHAIFLRRVTWRGVTYEIHNRSDVRMMEYQQFGQSGNDDAMSVM